MEDWHMEVQARRDDRMARREARKAWEENRPRRIASNVAKVAVLLLIALLAYAFIFFGALWASM